MIHQKRREGEQRLRAIFVISLILSQIRHALSLVKIAETEPAGAHWESRPRSFCGNFSSAPSLRRCCPENPSSRQPRAEEKAIRGIPLPLKSLEALKVAFARSHDHPPIATLGASLIAA